MNSQQLAELRKSSTQAPLAPQESCFRRFSNACVAKFNELKHKLASEMRLRFGEAVPPHLLRLALNEADAIAAATPFPLLFLPALAEEKVILASRWNAKQRLIKQRFSVRVA